MQCNPRTSALAGLTQTLDDFGSGLPQNDLQGAEGPSRAERRSKAAMRPGTGISRYAPTSTEYIRAQVQDAALHPDKRARQAARRELVKVLTMDEGGRGRAKQRVDRLVADHRRLLKGR